VLIDSILFLLASISASKFWCFCTLVCRLVGSWKTNKYIQIYFSNRLTSYESVVVKT